MKGAVMAIEEKHPIDKAYEDQIGKVFEVLFTGYLVAEGDKAKEKAADERFKDAASVLKQLRDHAKALMS
jgi:hypothetical protein